jgi:tricorn protease-like protein
MHRQIFAAVVLLTLCATRPAAADIGYLAVSGGTSQLWRMDVSGKRVAQVTHGATDIARISCFTDGRRVLANANQGTLEIIDLNNGAITPLTVPPGLILDGAISPSGSQIAFSFSRADSIDANDLVVAETTTRRIILGCLKSKYD